MEPDSAAEYIVQKIFARAWPPGSRLTERDIAEACGCTHAFARNVIHRLQIIGAVRFSSRRGASVIGPGDIDADEAARVWAALIRLLETKAGRTFAEPTRGRDGYARLLELRAELDRMGRKAQDPRLAELLAKIGLQRMIIAETAS